MPNSIHGAEGGRLSASIICVFFLPLFLWPFPPPPSPPPHFSLVARCPHRSFASQQLVQMMYITWPKRRRHGHLRWRNEAACCFNLANLPPPPPLLLLPPTRRRRRHNSRAHFLLHWETLQATCLGAERTHGRTDKRMRAQPRRSLVLSFVCSFGSGAGHCQCPTHSPQAGRPAISAAAADHERAEDGFIRPGSPHGPPPAPHKICQLLRRLVSCPSRRRPRHMLDWTPDRDRRRSRS